MEKSSGDPERPAADASDTHNGGEAETILPGRRKASPAIYRKATGPGSIQFLSDAFVALRQKLLVL